MKKKLMIFYFIISLFSLSSCSLFENEVVKPDTYEYANIDTKEELLLESISNVESSSIVVGYNRVGIFESTSMNYISGVIYKYESGYYYALTKYITSLENNNRFYIFNEPTNYIEASLVGYDAINELAVLKFESNLDLKVSSIDSTYEPLVGTNVFSLCSRQTKLSNKEYPSDNFNILYTGIVSRYNGYKLQHTAMGRSDEVGSALFDYNGKLIGINIDKKSSSSSDKKAGLNFSLYGNALYTVVSDIESYKGEVPRYQFNCTYEMVNKVIHSVDLPDGIESAMLIKSILSPNSFQSKIKVGDYICSINDCLVNESSDLTNTLNLLKTTDKVTFKIKRDNQYITVTN